MDYQDTEHYKTGLNEYLAEGIDYCTNTIKFAEQGDLEQLAADSFHAGYLRAMAEATNENSGLHLQRVSGSALPDTPDDEIYDAACELYKAGKLMNATLLIKRHTTMNPAQAKQYCDSHYR